MLFQLSTNSGRIIECLKNKNMTNFEYEIEEMKKNSIYIDCPAYFLSLSLTRNKNYMHAQKPYLYNHVNHLVIVCNATLS